MSFGQSAQVTKFVDNPAESQHIAPRFPGCEEKDVPGKYKYLCSQKRFVNFLDRYIKYPKDAVKSTTQGKVIISFIVETDGTISNATIERSPNESMGQECLDAINLLNEEEYVWKPAVVDGQVVRSRVDMPVDFKLGYKSIKSKKPMTYVNIPNLMTSVPVDEQGLALTSEKAPLDPETIYDDVEESPYFKSCRTDQSTLIERYKCSRAGYNAYIKEQLVYPESAKLKRIQGVAKVECVVELDGSVSAPRLLRDPGDGLGEEALRLISEMKDSIGMWTPGEIGGQAVRTTLELPIRFVLAEEDINSLVVFLDVQKNVIHDCIRISDIKALESIKGAKVKEISTTKAREDYGEKGRYGVYQVKLPKGYGRIPSSLKNQEEVEAYEMYFEGLTLSPSADDRIVEIAFDEFKEDGEIVVYGLNGRTLLNQSIYVGTELSQELDLSDSRGKLLFISIVQKDLVHTRFIKL